MIDTNKLSYFIKKSGLKKKYIADQLGICLSTFSRKLNNKVDFTISQIRLLCEILNIDDKDRDEIFFRQ